MPNHSSPKKSPSSKRRASPYKSPKSRKSASSPKRKRRAPSDKPDGRGKNSRIADPLPIAPELVDFLSEHAGLLTADEKRMLNNGTFSRPRISSFASRYSKRPEQAKLNRQKGHPERFSFWADAGMAAVLGRGVAAGSAVTYAQLQKKMSRFFV